MRDNVEAMLIMAERSMYESRLQEVLREFPCRVQQGITQLTEYLYLGGYQEAQNLQLLAGLGITHVLNCAAYRKSPNNPYPEWTGVIGYRQFEASDDEEYDIIQHVPAAKAFIDGARRIPAGGGKVLVHCARGINRSGAICVAYLMVDARQDLLTVAQHVKQRRGLVLTNASFRRQLIDFARKYSLLDKATAGQPMREQIPEEPEEQIKNKETQRLDESCMNQPMKSSKNHVFENSGLNQAVRYRRNQFRDDSRLNLQVSTRPRPKQRPQSQIINDSRFDWFDTFHGANCVQNNGFYQNGSDGFGERKRSNLNVVLSVHKPFLHASGK